MARDPIPSWFFVLVAVRKDDRFLLVQERKFDQTWYLPAGRVEPGEGFIETAHRETLEEAGIPIVVEGVLRFEHTPFSEGGTRVRAILVARPADDTPPKSTPDDESLGAAWVTLEELEQLPLRGEDASEIFHYLAQGGQVYPLSALAREGDPFTPAGEDG